MYIRAAKTVFNYLYLTDTPVKADLIIGFGHFDMNIPRRCAEYFLDGYAEKIVLTGGMGAGTADLNKPEAQAFWDILKKEFPIIQGSDVIVEEKSTNTSENILFSHELLKSRYPDFQIGNHARRIILVASHSRQRRVWLTCKRHFPDVQFINLPPKTDFENENALFKTKNRDYIQRMTGEIYRIIHYQEKGHIAKEIIPKQVMKAYELLQENNKI